MDRICQFSTIIFAGNISMLLIVAITTDYWEYRTFSRHNITRAFDNMEARLDRKSKTTFRKPDDTKSYFIVSHFSTYLPQFEEQVVVGEKVVNFTEYQPPAYLTKSVVYNITYNATNGNITQPGPLEIRKKSEDVIILFEQYGNLFRDCDSLEVGVRRRLGISSKREERCFNFVFSFRNGDFIHKELPAVIHLERSAFAFAVICICSMLVSLVGGAQGQLASNKDSLITASFAAFISGISLVISIALFHGKCHLLHKREFMANIDVPNKKIFNSARTFGYGWSFVLAWICVVLCFTSSWVWLHQAQDIGPTFSMKRRTRAGTYYAYKNKNVTLNS